MGLRVQDLGRCAYARAIAIQDEILARKMAGEADDHLLVVEHDPVYTLGRGADAADLRGAAERLDLPVFRVSRGGGVTFHGPGQLVAYPVLTLTHGGRDVHRYVRRLEAVLIGVCNRFGLPAERREGLTGVWVGDAKVASIGIGVRRWITFHGVALNVSTDLGPFRQVVPCRMPDVRMTSLALECTTAPTLVEVKAAFVHQFRAEFGYEEMPDEGRLGA
jgi:lipoate-protein ligase B